MKIGKTSQVPSSLSDGNKEKSKDSNSGFQRVEIPKIDEESNQEIQPIEPDPSKSSMNSKTESSGQLIDFIKIWKKKKKSRGPQQKRVQSYTELDEREEYQKNIGQFLDKKK